MFSRKIDHKKLYSELYNPPTKQFSVVTVPPLQYLMIDGAGDPNNNPAWKGAIEGLYALSFALKFAAKKQGADYTVMPLEGLWHTDESATEFNIQDRTRWQWTAMVMQPEQVTPALFETVRREVAAKKKLEVLERIRLETLDEGLSVQTMYIGAYADELPTIDAMIAFMKANGYAKNGRHHEIYLSDPNRVAPAKMKTVLREPTRKE
jgi:hypothetical protein